MGLASSRLLGHAVCRLVALDARMRRDPQDKDLIAALDQPRSHLDDGSGLLLAGAQSIQPGPSDCLLAVREHRVFLAGLAYFLENLERLVYGKNLGVEDLLIVAQVEASA